MTMTSRLSKQTLAQIIDSDPRAASIFESVGLDYCCGGGRTLETACRAAGIEVASVVALLQQTSPRREPADWVSLSPAELTDHIEMTHHAYLLAELPRLEELADRVAARHGGRFPEVLRVRELVTRLRGDFEPHLAKEQLVLFPMIRQLAAGEGLVRFHCGSLANPIRVMRDDHDTTAELLRQLDAVTGCFEAPSGACASFRALYGELAQLVADTHLHIHKENNVLFPAVLALEEARAEDESRNAAHGSS